MAMSVSLSGVEDTSIAEIGGKGYSLNRLLAAGLSVPPGFLLTAEFFVPWLEVIQGSRAWEALKSAGPEEWGVLCPELKQLCNDLPLSLEQSRTLDVLGKDLETLGSGVLFAVRSSSPEEDLAGASFAGGYETRLGVKPAELEEAIRICFASCLDERVFVYKKQQGLDYLSPRFALVIQKQLAAEVAGVGFSLNPLTNDYDEAVVDANWGLGESVVAGIVSPDHFVIDKVKEQIIEKTTGSKQVSIWLDEQGGTSRREGFRSGELSLTDGQLLELTRMISRIEELYRTPMDIEWAYVGEQLYILQARPITTYVPLPSEMITAPGERRRLYADSALSKGMTSNAPLSPIELDWMKNFYSFMEKFAGIKPTPDEGLVFFAGGRIYVNYSNILWLSNPRKLSKATVQTDVLMGEILAAVDGERYRSAVRPPWMRFRKLFLLPKLLWLLKGILWRVLWAVLAPARSYKNYLHRVEAYRLELFGSQDETLSLSEFRRRYDPMMIHQLFHVTMPVLGAGMLALGAVDSVVGKKAKQLQALAQKLKFGFTGDVVVEMGIALYRLSKLTAPEDFDDIPDLAERVKNRRMPPEFMEAWDDFQANYGWRGPLEMELASPRYGEEPGLALRQMSYMTGVEGEGGFDPQTMHQLRVNERRLAYDTLQKSLSLLRRVLLRRIYRLIELFAGTRDTPKHHIVLYNYMLRKRLLEKGARLLDAGKLNRIEDVFNLTFVQLESSGETSGLELRELIRRNTSFLNKLKSHVSEFPQVIDSRGRIQRPAPREEKPGELRGMAVSPGVVRGPIKLLHNPHEQPIEKGDVLVAYTTDPGWTPLFVNAAAVLLEVGGVLQHGAVVAREYGKPCVAGIDRVMNRLQNGQMVEVDGTAGVVRVLSLRG